MKKRRVKSRVLKERCHRSGDGESKMRRLSEVFQVSVLPIEKIVSTVLACNSSTIPDVKIGFCCLEVCSCKISHVMNLRSLVGITVICIAK